MYKRCRILPLAESEKDVYDRVIDYFEHEVSTFLKVGENVLIVSHGSPLRMLIKYLENVPDNDTFEIEEGTVIVYDFKISEYFGSFPGNLGSVMTISGGLSSKPRLHLAIWSSPYI